MEYALQVLNQHGPALGKRPTGRPRFVDAVTCAYCGGGGADPKYSSASGCPVCRGAGVVRVVPPVVVPPVVVCRRCAGSGRVSGDLICLTCNGVGMLSVRYEADTCPRCGGTGVEGIFYCNACKGQGIV
jgi:DnaJ-class molecular chaperone